jgi:protein-disulfide isomerase
MSESPRSVPPQLFLVLALVAVVMGGLGGFAAMRWRSDSQVHDYIVNHPEVLPEAMGNLRRQEDARQLSGMRADMEKPFPGAVLGNPAGKVTLVEFTDYACGYCRRSVADIDRLTADRPDLRVVVREMPILTPESRDAAAMALAAAEQGRYLQFHEAMFAIGRPNADTIAQAAQQAGLDMDRAKKVIADPRTGAEIDGNLDYGRKLGFQGTPSWVIGDRMLSGAVGYDALVKAVDEAKG